MFSSAEILANLPPDSRIEVRDEGGTVPVLVLRPRGVVRFFIAGFLLLWLCGWAAGEGFALWFVGAAIKGLLRSGDATRALPNPGGFSAAGLLAILAFISLWLALWTFGGIAALIELLRLLWGNDRLQFAPDRWSWTRGIGPFGVERSVDPRTLTGVPLRRKGGTLCFERGAKRWTVTNGGTDADRAWIVEHFWLPIKPAPAAVDELPEGWTTIPDSAGYDRLVSPTVGKGCGCLLFGTIVYNVIFAGFAYRTNMLDSFSGALGAVPFALVGLGLLALVVVGKIGRFEWRVGRDMLVRHWSLLAWVSEKRVAPDSLRIGVSQDSDGDDHFTLSGIADGKTLRIESQMNDSRRVAALGRWIAARTGWALSVPRGME